jgi:hypothetical protein
MNKDDDSAGAMLADNQHENESATNALDIVGLFDSYPSRVSEDVQSRQIESTGINHRVGAHAAVAIEVTHGGSTTNAAALADDTPYTQNGGNGQFDTDVEGHYDIGGALRTAPLRVQTQGFVFEEDEFPWDHTSSAAAAAFGGLTMAPYAATNISVARLVGASPNTIRIWRRHPGFQRRVDNLLRASADEIYDSGLAIKARRVVELQRRHGMLTDIIERRQEWAEEFADGETVVDVETGAAYQIPGISTGALILHLKSIGSGDFQRVVIEANFDTALMRELREIERQLAVELGQWSGDNGVKLNIKMYAGVNIDQV